MPEKGVKVMTDVKWEWFGLTFSWLVVLAIVLVLFVIIYFYIRGKKEPPKVDKGAGDEGED